MHQSFLIFQVTEFDLSDIKIVEQKTPYMMDIYFDSGSSKNRLEQLNSCSSIYKKSFKHFRDENILGAVCQICHCLGASDQLVLLVDHFLEIFRSTSASRKQVAFIINEILRGTIENNEPGQKSKLLS